MPEVLKKEDQAVELIKGKIKDQDKEKFYKSIYKSVLHDVIRYTNQMKLKNTNITGTKTLNMVKKIKDPHMYFYRKKIKQMLKSKERKRLGLSSGSHTDLMEFSAVKNDPVYPLEGQDEICQVNFNNQMQVVKGARENYDMNVTMNLDESHADTVQYCGRSVFSYVRPRSGNPSRKHGLNQNLRTQSIQGKINTEDNLGSEQNHRQTIQNFRPIDAQNKVNKQKGSEIKISIPYQQANSTFDALKNNSQSLYDKLKNSNQKIQSFDLEYYKEFDGMMIKDVNPQNACFGNKYINTLVQNSDTALKRSGLTNIDKKNSNDKGLNLANSKLLKS